MASLRGVYNAMSMKLDSDNEHAESLKSLMEQYLEDMGAVPEASGGNTSSSEHEIASSTLPAAGALSGLEDSYAQYRDTEVQIIKDLVAG